MAIYQDVGRKRDLPISEKGAFSPLEKQDDIREPIAVTITRLRSERGRSHAWTLPHVFHIVIVVPSNFVNVNPVNVSL